MGVNDSKIFTKVLNNSSLTIISSYGLRTVSFVLISGVGSYTGNLAVDGLSNDSIDLIVGQSVSVSCVGNQILTGLTIDSSLGGLINIIGKH
jgi:hypothetical protein|tara:strand:+ start:12027 stop:12302 length:276 start_codon:yes stop_codon:yes gene_type:complete